MTQSIAIDFLQKTVDGLKYIAVVVVCNNIKTVYVLNEDEHYRYNRVVYPVFNDDTLIKIMDKVLVDSKGNLIREKYIDSSDCELHKCRLNNLADKNHYCVLTKYNLLNAASWYRSTF